jgi:hypothetical protein
MSILLTSTPTCKQGYYWNGSACVPLHNFGTPTPYTAPLDASRRAAAVATLTTPPKDKPTPPTKVVASPASSTAVAPSFLLTRPEFSLEKNLQARQNLVAELVSSGDAARVLAPQLADPKNTKSVFELTQAALSSDPEFLQKIAAHKTAEFVKNEQAAYTTTNPVQKGANFVSALLSDPILTGANLMQGKRPLLGQAAVLRDPAHPAHNLVSTLSGANTNWLNDLVNSVNPASYATSAGVSANKNNYAQAGVDLGSAFLGGANLNKIFNWGKAFSTPLKSSILPATKAAWNTNILNIPGLTPSNLLWGTGAYMSGNEVVNPKSATNTAINTAIENPSLYNITDAAGHGAMTILGFTGVPYKAGMASLVDDFGQTSKYLTTQKNNIKISRALNKSIKDTNLTPSLNKKSNNLIPRLDLLNSRSSIGKQNDFVSTVDNYPDFLREVFLQKPTAYTRPLIRMKNHLQPASFLNKNNQNTKFKSLFCEPGSECAKTANSVNSKLFSEITGQPFDYNANAHNAWHMEHQMTRHGGAPVNDIIIGDRILLGNGVDNSTYAPNMIADPSIRHAAVYAGDIEHEGQRIPMVLESGRNNPLYLNPIFHTFAGEYSNPKNVTKAVRPAQQLDNENFILGLVDRNLRYAYRNKPAIYNSFSKNPQAQKFLDEMEKFREEVKNSYDLTNDEFNELRNSLIGIGAQETKLDATLPGSFLSKQKIKIQDLLTERGLTMPIKQIKSTIESKLNNVINFSKNSNLPTYPGASFLEKEAAILSSESGKSFTTALQEIKSKYQPKPKFTVNNTIPSRGTFRQKQLTELDQKIINKSLFNKDYSREALGLMAENFNTMKRLYPEANPKQLIDLTILSWNSPGKAKNKDLVDFYIFGKRNPNAERFSFDYVRKINAHKNNLIENPVNREGLIKHQKLHNEKGPEIFYREGGVLKINQ